MQSNPIGKIYSGIGATAFIATTDGSQPLLTGWSYVYPTEVVEELELLNAGLTKHLELLQADWSERHATVQDREVGLAQLGRTCDTLLVALMKAAAYLPVGSTQHLEAMEVINSLTDRASDL